MKTPSSKPSEMAVLCFIAVVGLIAAYICFGILKSEADGKYQGYSVGGAIAGALVSWTVLATIFLKLRKSTAEEEEFQNKRDLQLAQFTENSRLAAEQRKNELDELRKQVAELQSKLIRGAPKPSGYTIEIAERQNLVLARPAHWEPKGGTIFELELPDCDTDNPGGAAQKAMNPDDKFPATFRCYFIPIEKGTLGRDKFYQLELQNVRAACEGENPMVASYSTEKIRLGGDPSSNESLKIIARQYLRVRVGPSADTGEIIRSWVMISRDEFAGRIQGVFPPFVAVGQPQTIVIRGHSIRENASCYLNTRPLKSMTVKINNMAGFEIHAQLTEEDVRYPGQFGLFVLNPDTNGVHSQPYPLTIINNDSAHNHPPDRKLGSSEKPHDTVMASPPPAVESQPTGKTPETDTAVVKGPPEKPPKEKLFYLQVSRMRVLCYHEQLKTIYYFDFWDDIGDFVTSSDEFNQIVASARFLY